MEKGEIYLVSFRYEDNREITKIRPSAILVIGKDETYFYGIKLTSTARIKNKYSYKINDWKVAGLNHQTYAECNRIEYLTKDDLVKNNHKIPIKIGKLSINDNEQINTLCLDYIANLQEKIKPASDTMEYYEAEIARRQKQRQQLPHAENIAIEKPKQDKER